MNQIKNNLASLIQSTFCAFLIISLVFGFASNAFADQGTLKVGSNPHKWAKNEFTKLSFDWSPAKNIGTGKVSVFINGNQSAKSYDVPYNNIPLGKKGGKITNNTDKTISYTLSK